MSIEIRPATVSDAEGIAAVHIESWRAAYKGDVPAEVLEALSVKERASGWRLHLESPVIHVSVATSDERVVGFGAVRPTRDETGESGVGEIPTIYVLSSIWRQGIGRALCESILREARTLGFSAVTLWVLSSNRRAREFYEAFGFRLDGGAKIDTALTGTKLHEVRYRIATCL